jgi:hypothetical protein
MDFQYIENAALPRLAWIATAESGRCVVEHGRAVEARSGFFVEGIWNGGFARGAFDRCESFFGSGAVLRGPDIVFVPSSATVDYLYYLVDGSRLLCSNSLPFLLAAIGDGLNESDPRFGRINDSIMLGIDKYERDIPTRRGKVRRLMHHNLVAANGSVREVAKPYPPRFSDYAQYRSYLDDTLKGMLANAKDGDRRTPLRVLTTQSIGYDSTAINATAREYGIDLALTVAEPKERLGYYGGTRSRPESDSGEVICRVLGLDVETIDRRFFEGDPDSEYLYWAGIHNCQDMNLHQVAQYTGEAAVLLTGVLGEIWYTAHAVGPARLSCINDQIERWDLSCHGMSEARLHTGFIHAAIPYIGSRNRADIFAISNSDEMRPWSIGGTYDRPIARRLGEEAGVPREAFGQTKLATVVEIMPPYLPHGAGLKQEFFDSARSAFGSVGAAWMRAAQKLNFPLMILCRAYDKARRIVRARLPFMKPVQPTHCRLGEHRKSALYAFCVNKAAGLYAARTGTKKS